MLADNWIITDGDNDHDDGDYTLFEPFEISV